MINAKWHEKNKMPKNPTAEQRLEWHRSHAANCNCREFTKEMEQKLLAEIKRKIESRKVEK